MRRLAFLVSLTACGANIDEGMHHVNDDASFPDGAPPIDGAKLGWGTPTPIDIPAVGDDDPTATSDLRELYFNRTGDIYVTTRASTSDPWSTPVPVPELSTMDAETTPEVSADGLTMYLASARTGTLGGNDIWISTRAARTDVWGMPVHVPELSSTSAEGAPHQFDATHILIDTDRAGTLDIFMAQRASPTATWDPPARIDELSSTSSDGNPMLAGNQLTIYFDSNRNGDGELFVASRTSASATFGTPAPIAETSTSFDETDPWISPDGRTLYFTSNRDGTQRLWQTTR